MLKIKIGNTYAQTQGIEVPVTLRSSLFLDEGRIPGSYIFNFILPYTPELQQELGFIHRPNRSGEQILSRPFLLERGPLKYAGTCKVVKTTDKTVEISCPIETGDLAGILKAVNLPDLDLGGDRPLEQGRYLVSANTTEDMFVHESIPDPYLPIFFPIKFDGISINPDSILNTIGDTLLINETGKIVVSFKIDLLIENLTYVEIGIYRSGIAIFIEELKEGMNYIHTELDVEIYDTLELKISARRKYDNPNPLQVFNKAKFTIYTGAEINVFEQGVMNNNHGLELYPHSDYAVFPFENSKMLDNLDDDTFQIDSSSIKDVYAKYFPVHNYYKNNGFPFILLGERNEEFFFAFNLYNPCPYLAFVIKQLFAKISINIENNVFEDSDLSQLVIFNLFAENTYITSQLIKPKSGFNLVNHVPDVAASEYLLNLCKLLGIALSYSSKTKTVRFKYYKDIVLDKTYIEFPGLVLSKPELQIKKYTGYVLKQETSGDSYVTENFKTLNGLTFKGTVNIVNQLSGIVDPQINDCYYVNFFKEYWRYGYDPELSMINWIFHSKDFFFEKKDGDTDSTYELTSRISALMTNAKSGFDLNVGAPAGREWLIPKTERAGNFEGLPDDFKAETPLNLVFYRSLNYDSQGNLYPIATNDVYNHAGTRIDLENHDAQLSLRWDGEYGLWQKRHKAWVEWMLQSPGYFTISVYLDAYQLSELDFFRWYRINHHDYLIREIRFNITDQGISIAEMDVMKR